MSAPPGDAAAATPPAAEGAAGSDAAAAASALPPPVWRAVAFVNRLSGGQTGARVFAAAQKAGLDAVYDLSEGGPRCAHAQLRRNAHRRAHRETCAERAWRRSAAASPHCFLWRFRACHAPTRRASTHARIASPLLAPNPRGRARPRRNAAPTPR
jgi:hypothetical protein